jgi:hypothetical protein
MNSYRFSKSKWVSINKRRYEGRRAECTAARFPDFKSGPVGGQERGRELEVSSGCKAALEEVRRYARFLEFGFHAFTFDRLLIPQVSGKRYRFFSKSRVVF